MNDRILKMIDESLFQEIKATRVLLVGIGGVGGYALEALVRSGFQYITIVDYDVVDESNLNRQILTNQSNIGNKKTLEALKRAKEINPSITLNCLEMKILKDNIRDINFNDYDFVIDACDTLVTKFLLIKTAKEHKVKIISCMGTGNRIDASKLRIMNLKDTANDPVARNLRDFVKKINYNKKIKVICSDEVPVKNGLLGSMAMVPMAAGALCVTYVIQELQKKLNKIKK